MSVRVLVVDNHDSFVHTLVGYLHQLGAETEMIEADAETAAGFARLLPRFDAVMLSPGPGRPEDAGASVAVVQIAAAARTPLLGVCLGHQAIGVAFGTAVTEAAELMHGMVSEVRHDGSALFDGIPAPFDVGRYHSLALAADDLAPELVVTARTRSGTVMALAHRELPIRGVQFHPESVLTQHGYRLLANWLAEVAIAGGSAFDAEQASVGLSALPARHSQ
ncbi:anthranilate synthase component II [Microbacterium sp. A94]|uniref:anthranilate synthase component II n=1 Tax=Microbacterium sp. A94 TaxID=3450717 RepID=UPI003F4356CD